MQCLVIDKEAEGGWPNHSGYHGITVVENFFFVPIFGVELFLNMAILVRFFITVRQNAWQSKLKESGFVLAHSFRSLSHG